MRLPKLALALSVAAHLAVMGLLVLNMTPLVSFFGGGSGGAGGKVVTVWLTGPVGEVLGEKRKWGRFSFSEGSQVDRRNTPNFPMPAVVETRMGEAAGHGDGVGGGEGAGVGGGTGDGIGSGSGGDPVLSDIWKKIDRSKYYPVTAKRRGLEGTPKIAFEIARDGSVNWVHLTSSCGLETLDEAAVETVRRAAPFPYYPAPITLAVRYSLSD